MRKAAIVQEKFGFRLGERVMFTACADPDDGVEYGQTGTICSLDSDYGCDTVGVEWDIEKGKYHECSGKCKNHHGWWVPAEDLAKVDIDIGEIEVSEFNLDMLLGTT